MPVKLPVRTMNGNEVLWFYERHDQLEFFFAGMSADMDRRLASIGIIDFRTPLVKVVHHAANRTFIAGDMSRRQHNRIAFLNFEIFMVVECQSRKRRHRLSLAAAGNDAYLVTRMVANVFGPDHESRRDFEKTKLFGSVCVLVHAASQKAHEPAELFRLIDDEL